jgi:hypothetical protein
MNWQPILTALSLALPRHQVSAGGGFPAGAHVWPWS